DGYDAPNPRTRKAALIALDQMDGGVLKPEDVAPLLGSADPALKETASWIAGRHPEWGDALAGHFRERLSASGLSDTDRAELERQLARFAGAPSIQDLLRKTLRDDSAPRGARLLTLRAMAQSGLKEVPSEWMGGLV